MMTEIVVIDSRVLEASLYSASKISVTIPVNEWSSMVWAGAQDLKLMFAGRRWIVASVDLDARVVHLGSPE